MSLSPIAYLKSFASDRDDMTVWSGDAPNWRSFTAWAIVSSAAVVATLFLATFALNPFGNFPETALSQKFADDNQRFDYPSIVRSGLHDSAVFGSSTSRLLEPAALHEAFGGRFANLSFDAGTAWEQTQIFKLFLREEPTPKMVVLSVDGFIWCDPLADKKRLTFRLFPEGFYDANPFNDLGDILNLELADTLNKAVKVMLGSRQPYFDDDGFGDFTPGEANYDLARAQQHIRSEAKAKRSEPQLSVAELSSLSFPALNWLEDILATIPAATDVILARMPINVAIQPWPASRLGQSDAECLARIADLAARRGLTVFDMAIASPLTSNDSNYWDSLHYRLPVGRQIVAALHDAFADGSSSSILTIRRAADR